LNCFQALGDFDKDGNAKAPAPEIKPPENQEKKAGAFDANYQVVV
jgi:hypothetical protein